MSNLLLIEISEGGGNIYTEYTEFITSTENKGIIISIFWSNCFHIIECLLSIAILCTKMQEKYNLKANYDINRWYF